MDTHQFILSSFFYLLRALVSKDNRVKVEAEVSKDIYELCPTCGEGYLEGLWRIPIDVLVSEKWPELRREL